MQDQKNKGKEEGMYPRRRREYAPGGVYPRRKMYPRIRMYPRRDVPQKKGIDPRRRREYTLEEEMYPRRGDIPPEATADLNETLGSMIDMCTSGKTRHTSGDAHIWGCAHLGMWHIVSVGL